MRLAGIRINHSEQAGIVTAAGVVPVTALNKALQTSYHTDLLEMIQADEVLRLRDWYKAAGQAWLADNGALAVPFEGVVYAPLYRRPRKIFGIGLNYVDHAGDLAEKAPTLYPASFFKPDTTIIGHRDQIKIPLLSEKTTGEAELGVIMGKACANIKRENWLDYVVGFTTIIDMTAEDILRHNPRYLTMAKSFETFLSFGPHLVTPDEIDDVTKLEVATVINGEVHAKNVVSNMTFPPDELVAFHSKVMEWLPGDILSTGTPRAVQLNHGDVVECHITGFEPLVNPVVDKKK